MSMPPHDTSTELDDLGPASGLDNLGPTSGLEPSAIQRIKAGTRDLVRAAGGLERAGAIAGYSKTQMHRFASIGSSDVISLAGAMALEAEIGTMPITDAMRSMHVTMAAGESGRSVCFVETVAEAFRSTSAVSARACEAMADGTITIHEAQGIDEAASHAIAQLDAMRSKAARVLAGEVVPAFSTVKGGLS